MAATEKDESPGMQPEFSSRLHWRQRRNSLTRAADLRKSTGDFIDLTLSNPTRAGFPLPPPDLLSLSTPAEYAPAPCGLPQAREAVAAYYAENHGHYIHPEDIIITCSTSEAYAHLFRLFCSPGDEILIPRPSYPLFDFLAALEGATSVTFPLSLEENNRWQVDKKALEAAVTERSRILLLVNPNNPSGNFLTRTEVNELTEFCQRHNLVLIVDEVFLDYTMTPPPDAAGSCVAWEDAPLFVLSGLSKIAALPQMKLSWIVARGPRAWRYQAVQALALISDTFLSTGSAVQVATEKLLRFRHPIQTAILQRLRSNWRLLCRALQDLPVRLLPPEGGWSVILILPDLQDDEAWAIQLVKQEGILLHPGYLFDFKLNTVLVASLLTPEADWQEGCQRLHRALSSACASFVG